MPASIVSCPHCQSRLQLPAVAPGVTALRCPKCSKPFAIPARAPGPAAVSPTVSFFPAADTVPPASDPAQAATLDMPPAPPSTEERTGSSVNAVGGETVDESLKPPQLSFRETVNRAKRLPLVPGYEVLDELGRGGMGVVYRARQLSLKRLVALKMILAGDAASVEELTRFRTEAEAVAHLHHPNIVQIYEIGEHQNHSFFSLEFVAGGSLAARLKTGPLPPTKAAQLTEVLARAIQHAHQRGVVHRDLKPANILLMEDGTPKVTDFGLAKRFAEQDAGQTRSGAVVGTPSYMAPEQALGKSHEIGPAVDVYALGAILYELLTGKPPFRGETTLETLQQVIEKEPVPPSHYLPKLDRDLETVCLKALAKAPAQRYGSALALAQDLERYQAGEPILARREGALRRLGRKARRHLKATLTGVVLLLIAGVAALAFLSASTTRQASTLMGQIETGLDARDWSPAHRDNLEKLLAELEPLDAEQAAAQRKRLHQRFAQRIQNGLHAVRLSSEEIQQLEADLTWLDGRDPVQAKALRAGLRDRLTKWQPLFDVRAPFDGLAQVFAPELVAGKGPRLLPVAQGGNAAPRPAVVPTRVASRGAVQLEADFDASWQEAHAVGLALNHQQAHRAFIFQVAFSPDGKFIYSASQDGTARVWEAATGRPVLTIHEHGAGVPGLAISPDGKVLATCAHNGKVILWEAATGKKLATGFHSGASCVAFSADGKHMASGSVQKTVAVWETVNLKQLAILKDQPGPVRTIAFGPGDKCLTVVTPQGEVAVWNLDTQKIRSTWAAKHKTSWHAFALSPDARTLALGSRERTALFDPSSGAEKGVAPLAYEPGLLALAPNGRRLAAAFHNLLRVVTVPNEKDDDGQLMDETTAISALAFAPDGDLLAVALHSGQLLLWDVHQKVVRWRQGAEGYVFLLTANVSEDQPKDKAGQAQAKAAAEPPISFAIARARSKPFEMRLLRNGVVLQKKAVRLPAGPLHLLARRDGDRLEFQAGRGQSLVFHDLVPFSGGQAAVFGVCWAAPVGLTHLRAIAQTLPPAPSPLEQADDLFEKGRQGDALALYQGQLAAATNPAVKQEAQCKAGMCLVQLNRLEDAAQQFGALASAEGDRWPLIAACQLLMVQLQQKKFDGLDNLLTTLSTRFRREQLVAYVPAQLRQDIMRYSNAGLNDLIMAADPAVLRRAEQAQAIARFFDDPHHIYWSRYHLAQLLAVSGQEEKALSLLKECARESEAQFLADGTAYAELLYPGRWYTWLQRRHGGAAEALRFLDRCLCDEAGRPRLNASLKDRPGDAQRAIALIALYIERARTYAALGKWDRAEADIDEMARLLPPTAGYQFHAANRILKGWLCERRGDLAGAKRAWKEGMHSSYLQRLSPEARATAPPLAGENNKEALLNHLMMAALCDELPDADAGEVLQHVLKLLGGGSFVGQMVQAVKVQPAVLREMWRSPRGRELARRLAFLDLPAQGYVRFPLYLCAAQVFKQGTLGGEPPAEVEEQLWQITTDLGEALFAGRLRKTQLLQIGLAYKGATNALGWKGVAPTLEPSLRGKVAYLLGLRYARLKRANDAVTFFRTVVTDAPAGSALRRLADAELKRGPQKK